MNVTNDRTGEKGVLAPTQVATNGREKGQEVANERASAKGRSGHSRRKRGVRGAQKWARLRARSPSACHVAKVTRP